MKGNKDKDAACKLFFHGKEVLMELMGVCLRQLGYEGVVVRLEERNPEIVAIQPDVDAPRAGRRRLGDLACECWLRRPGHRSHELVFIEFQSVAAYDMPLRNGQLVLTRQRANSRESRKGRLERGELRGSPEFLSGMKPGEKMPGVIALTVHTGLGPWEVAMRYLDIVDEGDPSLTRLMPDSPSNFVSLRDIPESEAAALKTHLRPLVMMLKYHGDRGRLKEYMEGEPLLADVPASFRDIASAIFNWNFKAYGDNGSSDMRTVFNDVHDEALAEGRRLGRAEGKKLGRAQGERIGRESIIHDSAMSMKANNYSTGQIRSMLAMLYKLTEEQINACLQACSIL